MIFFRFFSASLILFFTLPVFAGTQESFIFLTEKINTQLDRNSMLSRSLSYLYIQSDPEYLSELFFLEQKNKSYILDKINTTKTFSEISQNISFFTDIDTYINTDIWGVLDTSYNRTETTDEYIALGDILLKSSDSRIESFSAQGKGLKKEISIVQKKVSQLKKEYKKSLYGWDSEKIESFESQIVENSQFLLERELQYEKIQAYNKRISQSRKNLYNRLTGAKENRDALIKNVRVQGDSGKFIEAIE